MAAKPRKPARHRDLARIHMLAAQLGLDTKDPHGAYRDMLWAQARVESSAQLDAHGRAKVIAHLEALAGARQKYQARPHNADAEQRKELRKIEALIADADLPWAYPAGILRQQTRGRKTRLEFASKVELAAVVAALEKAALKRLHAECERTWGGAWPDVVASIAATLFRFDPIHRDITRYTQPISQALRWWRGELQSVCAWPSPATGADCCAGCLSRLDAAARERVG